MSHKIKNIIIKNRTYYFFHDIIDIENVHTNNIKIDEKSYKKKFIYYIAYVTIKEYVKNYSLNPLYLIFSYVNRYFEEINGNKYLTLVATKEIKKKCEVLWSKIRDLIRSMTKKSDDYMNNI